MKLTMNIVGFLLLVFFPHTVSTLLSPGRVLFEDACHSLRPPWSHLERRYELPHIRISKPLATTFVSLFLMIDIGIAPTYAAIGEGDLPGGALSFQKVTKAQKE